jgi:hypothetical protein
MVTILSVFVAETRKKLNTTASRSFLHTRCPSEHKTRRGSALARRSRSTNSRATPGQPLPTANVGGRCAQNMFTAARREDVRPINAVLG